MKQKVITSFLSVFMVLVDKLSNEEHVKHSDMLLELNITDCVSSENYGFVISSSDGQEHCFFNCVMKA